MMGAFWRKDNLFPALLLLVAALRFLNLDGGIVPAEPDEVIYEEILRNFYHSPWPHGMGGEWYYNLPLYPFLGYLFSFIFTGRFQSLRLVSLLSTAILALGIYFYLRWKSSSLTGFFSAVLFLVTPFSLFYSRLGLIEPLAVSLGLLFLLSFDYSLANRKKSWALLSGLFLGLAILSKYTSLIFLFFSAIVFLVRSCRLNFPLTSRRTVLLDIYSTLSFLTAFLLVFPVFLVLRSHNPYLFKLHLLTSLGLNQAATWSFNSFFLNLRNMPLWLSPPVLILFLAGLLALVTRGFRKQYLFLFAFTLSAAAVFTRAPFYPRYFFLLLPFVSIASGWGLACLVKMFQRFNALNFKTAVLLHLFLILLLILPFSLEAYAAGRHRLIEETGEYIKSRRQGRPWVFSNYWPHFFGRAVGTERASWLANNVEEVRAFVPGESRDALTILREEGGFVVLEELFSAFLVQPAARVEAVNFIRERYRPEKIVVDPAPNFPYFRKERNKVYIYSFSPPDGCKKDSPGGCGNRLPPLR